MIKLLATLTLVVLVAAAASMLISLNENPPQQTPIVSATTSTRSQAHDSDAAPVADTSLIETAGQQAGGLDTLLATLYASSDVDALLAGALVSQHLLDPEEELYDSYRPKAFYALALSLDARDPILLFVLSNYCLSDGGSERFCQQNRYLQSFSEVSGDNAIAWAMRATQSYRSGDYHEIPSLLDKTGHAILFTDYWPEVMLVLLQAFQQADFSADLQEAYFSAFEVAPSSFLFYRDLLAMCTASSELDNSAWLSGCQSLGRIMQQGSSLMTTSTGISIESSANRSLGLETTLLSEQTAEVERLSALLTNVTRRGQIDAASLQRYLDDLAKYGEKESLSRMEP